MCLDCQVKTDTSLQYDLDYHIDFCPDFHLKLRKCQEVKDHIHVQVYMMLASKLFTVTIISFSYTELETFY